MTVPEIKKLEHCIKLGCIVKHAFGLPDGNNSKARMVIWNHPGSDYTGMIGRCKRIVETAETVSVLI